MLVTNIFLFLQARDLAIEVVGTDIQVEDFNYVVVPFCSVPGGMMLLLDTLIR